MPIMQGASGGNFNSYTGGLGQRSEWAANPDIAAQGAWGLKSVEAQNKPALAALAQKDSHFNQLFPWLQNQIGAFNGNMATAGGNSGQSPTITVGGVWNPQQIQQQVNATRAQNDQSMQSQNRQQQQTTAGQGFGSHSPILQALQGQNFASNLATNTQAEQSLRTGTAQQNQQATLASQQAREAQFANRQREDIERRKPYFAQQSALIAALGGLM